MKAEIAEAEIECKAIEDKSSKLDSLIDRVSKATQIENEQLKKMNEVIGIFKACSDQLQKEKVPLGITRNCSCWTMKSS